MWYVWHGCIKKQRDILSVVIVLAIPRPLDYSRLFVACSAVSAMWALAWGLVCKELHMLELHFLFSVTPLSRCSERINNTASEFISPSLRCSVFLLPHLDSCLAVFPLKDQSQAAALNSFFFFFSHCLFTISLINGRGKPCIKCT